jgi:hypothetical protein
MQQPRTDGNRQATFEQFLHDFAHASELGMAGELEEGLSALEHAKRDAEDALAHDLSAQLAITYRYDVAIRLFRERYCPEP